MSQRSCHLQHEPRSLVSRPRLGLTSESGDGALQFGKEERTMDKMTAPTDGERR